jgi:hypothetical protein
MRGLFLLPSASSVDLCRLFRVLRWEYSSTIRALLVSAIKQVRRKRGRLHGAKRNLLASALHKITAVWVATPRIEMALQIFILGDHILSNYLLWPLDRLDSHMFGFHLTCLDVARNQPGTWKPSSPRVALGIRCTSSKVQAPRAARDPWGDHGETMYTDVCSKERIMDVSMMFPYLARYLMISHDVPCFL